MMILKKLNLHFCLEESVSMKVNLIILFLLYSYVGLGQERYYTDPVKIPILLSGTFAELRSNHFHSGIDIKTQGQTGFPVYSVADGFISRIVVSPTGYGRALYISHPNGTTSVYGHLESFREDIQEFVKTHQYNQKSFRVDIQLLPGRFQLKKNEQIALTGNSGSSGGPHLHFEIRDTRSEYPLNPLKNNFSIKDNIPPKIFSLMVVPLNDTSHVNYETKRRTYPVVYYDGKYHIKNNPTVPVYGEIGFALKTYDYLNGTWNKCGVNDIQLTVDDELYFSYSNNEFSFDESRYINSFILYDEFINHKSWYVKTWIEPGNQLSVYPYSNSNGILNANKNGNHSIRIELKDSYNNKSVMKFDVKTVPKKIIPSVQQPSKEFSYDVKNYFHTDECKLTIPKGSLYKNLQFNYHKMSNPPGYYSDIHVIHKSTVPLHKHAELKIKSKNLPNDLQDKALIVLVDDISGEPVPAGGTFSDGWLTAKIRSFGQYAVKIDTLPPVIKPLSIINSTTLNESTRIRFRIEDDLSGINTIEGKIDGQWALFEYDAKYKLITHYFDAERFELNKKHYLRLSVTDYKGNNALYEATFWK